MSDEFDDIDRQLLGGIAIQTRLVDFDDLDHNGDPETYTVERRYDARRLARTSDYDLVERVLRQSYRALIDGGYRAEPPRGVADE